MLSLSTINLHYISSFITLSQSFVIVLVLYVKHVYLQLENLSAFKYNKVQSKWEPIWMLNVVKANIESVQYYNTHCLMFIIINYYSEHNCNTKEYPILLLSVVF